MNLEFSILNNFYIKDVSTPGPISKYWKYIVDDVEYYVPNCGYLVMFDSNYVDQAYYFEFLGIEFETIDQSELDLVAAV